MVDRIIFAVTLDRFEILKKEKERKLFLTCAKMHFETNGAKHFVESLYVS